MDKKKCFTLAETLVTLVILGVIAVLTVPGIVNKIQDRIQISAMKRAYALIDNALQQMYVIEGAPEAWKDWNDNEKTKTDIFGEHLSRYLPVEKFCGSSSGCFVGVPYYYGTLDNKNGGWGTYSGDNSSNFVQGKMLLKNDMMIATSWGVPDTFSLGPIHDSIRVDINGKKGPNRYGYDVFFFMININKGQLVSNINNGAIKEYCSKESNAFSYTHRKGATCYLWVIKHNNMDYKYRDVRAEW